MKKLIGTMTALVVALSASVALAGTYVSGPLPSEFTGGYLPPDPNAYKAIAKSSTEGSKLAGGLSKCYSKGAKNVSKGLPSGVNECISNSKKGVVTKYLAKQAKIASKSPLPPCGIGGTTAANLLTVLVSSFNGVVYCQSPSGAFLDLASF